MNNQQSRSHRKSYYLEIKISNVQNYDNIITTADCNNNRMRYVKGQIDVID